MPQFRGRDIALLSEALEVALPLDTAGEARVLELGAEYEAKVVRHMWKAQERGWRSWVKAGRPS